MAFDRKNFHLHFPAKNNISPGVQERDSRVFPGSPLGGNQVSLSVISAGSAEFACNEVLLHGKISFRLMRFPLDRPAELPLVLARGDAPAPQVDYLAVDDETHDCAVGL